MESKGDNSITIAPADNPITVKAQTRRFPNAALQGYQIHKNDRKNKGDRNADT